MSVLWQGEMAVAGASSLVWWEVMAVAAESYCQPVCWQEQTYKRHWVRAGGKADIAAGLAHRFTLVQ